MQLKNHTLTEKLSETVKTSPNSVALQIKTTNDYTKHTYQDLYNNALSIAESLIDQGIEKGDRVAIILENRPEWAFIYFGILFAGAIAVPLDPQSVSDELKYFFEDSECKIVFTSPKFETVASEAAHAVPTLQNVLVIDQEFLAKNFRSSGRCPRMTEEEKILRSSPRACPRTSEAQIRGMTDKTEPNDIASILYTSGTTGKPKGVMLTHENFYSDFASIEKLKVFTGKHNVLSILPLHHSFPFMVTLIIPLFTGNKVTYIGSLKREEITSCMQETGVTILAGVPQFFYLFYQAILNKLKELPLFVRLPLLGLTNAFYKFRQLTSINLNKSLLSKVHATFGKNLKYFVCGGAKLDKEIEIFFNKIGFTLIQGYGLTETSPIVTLNPPTKIKIGSAGKVIPGDSIKLIEPDKNGIGEVAIYGPNVMLGYYKKEKETSEVLKDGWFYSGDLGYIDKQGYLFLSARKKELIVLSSGKNVSPEEVEKHYLQTPYIKELCILLSGKDDNEKLSAVIVPDLEHFKKVGEININDTIKLELDNLSKKYPLYKTIMGFVTTKDKLSRTHLGKLQRHKIHDEYLDELMGAKPKEHKAKELDEEDLNILSLPLYRVISDTIKKSKQLENPVNLDDHLSIDLGFDSLSRIELFSVLEKKLNIQIPENSMAEISTVKELFLEVNKLTKETSAQPTAYTEESINIWENLFKNDPKKSILDKIDLSPSWLALLIHRLFCGLLFIISKLMWRIKVLGTKNLPKDKSFILCPNHTSYLDAFLILATIPNHLRKNIFFLGFHTYFDVPIIRNLIKIGHIIPIDPATNLIDAIQACGYVLKHGKAICIFPEGARSPNGKLQEFKKGVGILAEELNTPLLPTYIDGAFEALPRDKTLPRFNQIKIIFGKLLGAKEAKEKGSKLGVNDNYEAIASGVQKEVKNLPQNNSTRHQ